MKKFALLICILLCSVNVLKAQNFLIFLHNQFLEEKGLKGVHPQYGKVEYNQVINAFKKQHFTVLSEIRPAGTDAKKYAKLVERQIDSLYHLGIPPNQITVVGTSKGGTIAMYVSSIMKDKNLNFVFIGCCPDGLENAADITFYGNILSIHEKSDDIGKSCMALRNKSGDNVGHFKEIELNTGLRHGFLFKALPQWINPSILWAHGQFDAIK